MLLGPILPILISRWSLSEERVEALFYDSILRTACRLPFDGRADSDSAPGLQAHVCDWVRAHCARRGPPWAGQPRKSVSWERALCGYGLGLALTGGNLWVAEIFPQRRATAVSILNVTWTIGAIACGPLVMLAEDLHMLAKFLVGVALFHAICALLIGAWEIEPLEYALDRALPSHAAPRTRLIGAAAFALSALFFLYVGTESAVGGWVAAYANRVESISTTMSALTPAFFWCGLMTGRALAPAATRASRRTKTERRF